MKTENQYFVLHKDFVEKQEDERIALITKVPLETFQQRVEQAISDHEDYTVKIKTDIVFLNPISEEFEVKIEKQKYVYYLSEPTIY